MSRVQAEVDSPMVLCSDTYRTRILPCMRFGMIRPTSAASRATAALLASQQARLAAPWGCLE